jgi:hypothetical protein
LGRIGVTGGAVGAEAPLRPPGVGRAPPGVGVARGAEGAPGVAAGAEDADAAGAAEVAGPNVSFSLRTTGGSTVEDADFTNSPMSFNLARTVLLSTPSSLASS